MQSRCRRRDRASLMRVDGLIALAIVRPIGPTNVRWQWNVADTVDCLGHRAVFAGEPNRPTPEEPAFEHLPFEPDTVAFEQHFRSGLQLLPGMHQRLPQLQTPNSQRRCLSNSQLLVETPNSPQIFLSNSQTNAVGRGKAVGREFPVGSWMSEGVGSWEFAFGSWTGEIVGSWEFAN